MCKKVFIDTNIFIGEKFMLSNDKFEKLKTYIENDKIILLNNEITERELEVHIIKDVKEVINSYNKVLSKSPFLEILSETPIKLSLEDETYIISFLKTELIKFFDDSIKFSLEDVDIKLILEDHFNLNLPFEKTKQNEFKDAFVAQIIKKYQKKNNEKIYIISKDDGFRKTFDNNDQNFIIFENLSKFIEEIEMEMLTENEKFLINEIKDGEANDKIKDFIDDIGLEIDYDSSDYEIDNYEIIGIYPEFINSCETENIQIYEFNVKLDIEIEITYLDEDSSYYDKEDGEYLFSNYITAKEEHNTEFKLVILCDIKDLENKSIEEDFFLDYITIDNEKSDKRIYLDEYTCEDREIINETINNS